MLGAHLRIAEADAHPRGLVRAAGTAVAVGWKGHVAFLGQPDQPRGDLADDDAGGRIELAFVFGMKLAHWAVRIVVRAMPKRGGSSLFAQESVLEDVQRVHVVGPVEHDLLGISLLHTAPGHELLEEPIVRTLLAEVPDGDDLQYLEGRRGAQERVADVARLVGLVELVQGPSQRVAVEEVPGHAPVFCRPREQLIQARRERIYAVRRRGPVLGVVGRKSGPGRDGDDGLVWLDRQINRVRERRTAAVVVWDRVERT